MVPKIYRHLSALGGQDPHCQSAVDKNVEKNDISQRIFSTTRHVYDQNFYGGGGVVDGGGVTADGA